MELTGDRQRIDIHETWDPKPGLNAMADGRLEMVNSCR